MRPRQVLPINCTHSHVVDICPIQATVSDDVLCVSILHHPVHLCMPARYQARVLRRVQVEVVARMAAKPQNIFVQSAVKCGPMSVTWWWQWHYDWGLWHHMMKYDYHLWLCCLRDATWSLNKILKQTVVRHCGSEGIGVWRWGISRILGSWILQKKQHLWLSTDPWKTSSSEIHSSTAMVWSLLVVVQRIPGTGTASTFVLKGCSPFSQTLPSLYRVFHVRTSSWRISLSRQRWARWYAT